MRIVSLQTLKVFGVLYPDALQPLLAWYDEVASANWTQPADIKARYASASILKNRRVVIDSSWPSLISWVWCTSSLWAHMSNMTLSMQKPLR
jgi:mRNA-degrading endonuclease HigB of HigAB toxin-antitoxin module